MPTGRSFMTSWILLWIATATVFVVIDMLWLLWLGRGFYVSEIGELLKTPPSLAAAGAFYVLYVTGLMILVIWPAFQANSIGQALLYGAVAGAFAYGTYDLTNLAVMKGFTAKIAMIDMAWGTFLTAATSALAVWIGGMLRS
jgi:uncharacterized membrane protein